MVGEKKLPLPSVPCALGMAVSYYTYPFFVSISRGIYIIIGILLIIVIAVNVLRVIRFLPGVKISSVYTMSILAVALAAGFSLGIASRRSIPVSAMGIPMEKVTAVTGILKEDPRTLQGGSGFGSLELLEASGQGGLRVSARGIVNVFFPAEAIPRLKEFGRGCEMYIDCTVTSGDRGMLCRAASVHITKPAPVFEAFRTSIRMALLEKFQNRQNRRYVNDHRLITENDAPLWGGLASAMLLGMRDDLDIDLSMEFRNSGCAHILALSGMHLAIITGLLAFLLKRPLGIRVSSFIGAVFIIFYVFIAGSQPSLVRSAIMYLIGTLAAWNFLKTKAVSLLSMAFIVQLIFQSRTGMSLSFILSYLALWGMLTMGETFRSLFHGRIPDVINGSISASLGAFIMTAPVVTMYFENLKPIGIIAGLLIMPLSSLFMVLSLAALFASFLPIPLWEFLDIILTGFYRFLEVLISLAGKVPGLNNIKPIPVLVFSILLWLLITILKRFDNAKRNSIASFD